MTLPVCPGGRVGQGHAGATIAGEADEREDAGGGGAGREERADGAPVAGRGVAVDDEGAADVAVAGGPVRGRVAVGGGAAPGGGYGGAPAGADGVPGVVPSASGSLRTREDCGRCSGECASGGRKDGPDREVYCEQVAVPGREAEAFDFTDASDLGVTIRGVALPHLLFEWVLSYSRWTYVSLALSETLEALVAGLQGALWTLGAVLAVLRRDNVSAATHELKRSGGRQLTGAGRAGAGPLRAALVADPAGEADEKSMVSQHVPVGLSRGVDGFRRTA